MMLEKISENYVKQDGNGNTQIFITKNSVYDDYRLFDFKTSSGDPLASLVWMGASLSSGVKILQPAIATNIPGHAIFLSYDGRANYVGDSELIAMPSDGSRYSISPPMPYYFNNNNPLVFDPTYSLSCNNQSIEMRNISIFKRDYSQGVMVELRASLEGSMSGISDDGYIVIFLKIKTIH